MKTVQLFSAWKKSAIAAAAICAGCCASVAQAQSSVYRPGLIQAKFESVNSLAGTYSLPITNSPTAERTPGAVMANVRVPSGTPANTIIYTNPYSDIEWCWGGNNSGFGYAGEMYVEENTTYTFGKLLDDGARIMIDGTPVLTHETWDVFETKSYTATTTGWLSVDIRIYDGTGGKGPTGSAEWGNDLGLAFNTVGLTARNPKATWRPLIDPGDMSLFRAPHTVATITTPDFEIPPILTRNSQGIHFSATLTHGEGDVFALLGANDVYEFTNSIAANVTAVETVGGLLTVFDADTAYNVAAYATNTLDEVSELRVASPTIYTGELSLELINNAEEENFVPGIVRVSRANATAATRLPLTVNYAFIADTATEGVNYSAPSGSIVIPAGAASADIAVAPLIDSATTTDTSLTVALTDGFYFINASASEVEVNIVNWEPPSAYNVWVAPADGLASDAGNWTQGVPTSIDHILLGAFSSANMIWDAGVNGLTDIVASWTQDEFYTGEVTFNTQYIDAPNATFTNFTVTGNAEIAGGIWTHPANNDAQIWRLCLTVGEDFTLAATAKINLQHKGYAMGHFPAGGATGVHGGSRNDFAKVYGDVYQPESLGAGGSNNNKAGGGALFLNIAGAALINGIIDANSHVSTGQWDTTAGGAGGSVYIKAAAINGNGAISSNGSLANGIGSSGGRIALIATAANTLGFPIANVYARGDAGNSGLSAGGGTVFLKTANQPNGTLLIDNSCSSFRAYPGFLPTTKGTTCIPAGETWTFDSIITRRFGVLSIPEGATLVLPNGFASVTSADTSLYDGILYLGGEIILGGSTPHIFQSDWIFQADTPYTLNGDVHVTNNGAFGCIPLRATLADFPKTDLTINGNLTVDAGSRITAVNAGVDYDASSPSRPASHGGQPGSMQDSRIYGSILNPAHPGTWGSSSADINSSSRQPGSGVIHLTVNGAVTINGVLTSAARDIDYENYAGSGGSINLTASSLAGTGLIETSGYKISSNHANKYGGGPGRIAIRLTQPGATFETFGETNIQSRGWSVNDLTKTHLMTSAGTVYLETADDAPDTGKVIIWNDNNANNTVAFTPLPSIDYGGSEDNLRNITLDIGNRAHIKLFDSFRVESAAMQANTKLDLNGCALTLKLFTINGAKIPSGQHTAAQLLALGFTEIVDTSLEADGIVNLIAGETMLIIR